LTGIDGKFIGITAGAQLSVSLMSSLSAVVSTNYFKSELQGAANLFGFTTSVYQRNSFRVGLNWSLPLYDSSTRRPR
jgi:hypothetical protein